MSSNNAMIVGILIGAIIMSIVIIVNELSTKDIPCL
jgi:hypothetical protein